MQPRFVSDGETRLTRSPELQAKLHALRESIHAGRAAELASAGFLRRCLIRWQMVKMYRRARRELVPSSRSLYSSGMIAADRS